MLPKFVEYLPCAGHTIKSNMLSNLTSKHHYTEKIKNSIYRTAYTCSENLNIIPKVQGITRILMPVKKQKPLYLAFSNAHVKTLSCKTAKMLILILIYILTKAFL